MFELFMLGSFWFWALLVGAFFLEVVFVECEKVGWATFIILLTCAALHFLGDVKVFSILYQNPGTALVCVGGYFAIGIGWSIVKWMFYTSGVRRQYDVAKKEFLSNHDVKDSVVPARLRREWENCYDARGIRHTLDVSRNKSRITMWIGYWPFSALWTLIDDPIKRLVHFIFDCLKDVYESISNRQMRGIEDDFTKNKDSE